MNDPFLKIFAWLTPVLQEPSFRDMPLDPVEREIVDKFISGWGNMDTEELLKGLSKQYGDAAGKTIDKVLARKIKEDWAATGAKEAHEGTEIADFIRLLWEPLEKEGFAFTYEKEDGNVKFRVTKCPVYDLAESTGLHDWLYHLACATDFYSTCAFSSKIDFRRTKTLMEGDSYCDHSYYAKKLNTSDS